MTKKGENYKCAVCGNEVAVTTGGGGTLFAAVSRWKRSADIRSGRKCNCSIMGSEYRGTPHIKLTIT